MSDEFVLPATPSLEGWRVELAECYSKMQKLCDMDVNEIFQTLSQFTGRASEMRFQLGTHETRAEQQFRTKIIEPFIEECDRQFKFHSRATAVREMDARLAGGRFA